MMHSCQKILSKVLNSITVCGMTKNVTTTDQASQFEQLMFDLTEACIMDVKETCCGGFQLRDESAASAIERKGSAGHAEEG